jgi:hypothetical protein
MWNSESFNKYQVRDTHLTYDPLLQQHHNNTHNDLKTQQEGHKKREAADRNSAKEVYTTRRGREWKQSGTISPESTRGVVRIRLYANDIARNNIR